MTEADRDRQWRTVKQLLEDCGPAGSGTLLIVKVAEDTFDVRKLEAFDHDGGRPTVAAVWLTRLLGQLMPGASFEQGPTDGALYVPGFTAPKLAKAIASYAGHALFCCSVRDPFPVHGWVQP